MAGKSFFPFVCRPLSTLTGVCAPSFSTSAAVCAPSWSTLTGVYTSSLSTSAAGRSLPSSASSSRSHAPLVSPSFSSASFSSSSSPASSSSSSSSSGKPEPLPLDRTTFSPAQVQQLFQEYKGGKFGELAKELATLDGAELSAMTKDDFKEAFGVLVGSAMYNAWNKELPESSSPKTSSSSSSGKPEPLPSGRTTFSRPQVQQFWQEYEGGEYTEEAKKLARLTGAELSLWTKDDFKEAFGVFAGSTMYDAWNDGLRQAFSSKITANPEPFFPHWISPSGANDKGKPVDCCKAEIVKHLNRIKTFDDGSKQSCTIQIIEGGAGTGKTRLGMEVGRIAEEMFSEAGDDVSVREVFFTMESLAKAFDVDDEKTTTTHGHNVLAQVLLEGLSGETVKKVPSLETVLQMYRDAEKDKDKMVMVVVQIDEPQEMTQLTANILRAHRDTLATQKELNVRLVPIPTGTSLPAKPLAELIGATKMNLSTLRLSPLTVEQSEKLIKGYGEKIESTRIADLLEKDTFLQLIAATGGIPRFVQWLAQLAREPKGRASLRRLQDMAFDKYQHQYADLGPARERLLNLAMHKDLDLSLDRRINGHTFGELFKAGLLYLTTERSLVMPQVLWRAVRGEQTRDKKDNWKRRTPEALSSLPRIKNFQEFELVAALALGVRLSERAVHEACRCADTKAHPERVNETPIAEVVTLPELFVDGIVHPTFSTTFEDEETGIKILLPSADDEPRQVVDWSTERIRLNLPFYRDNMSHLANPVVQDVYAKNLVINRARAPTADVETVLFTPDGQKICIGMQAKHQFVAHATTTLYAPTIKAEALKFLTPHYALSEKECSELLEETQQKANSTDKTEARAAARNHLTRWAALQEYYKDKTPILVVITNQPCDVTPEKLPLNTILITNPTKFVGGLCAAGTFSPAAATGGAATGVSADADEEQSAS